MDSQFLEQLVLICISVISKIIDCTCINQYVTVNTTKNYLAEVLSASSSSEQIEQIVYGLANPVERLVYFVQ